MSVKELNELLNFDAMRKFTETEAAKCKGGKIAPTDHVLSPIQAMLMIAVAGHLTDTYCKAMIEDHTDVERLIDVLTTALSSDKSVEYVQEIVKTFVRGYFETLIEGFVKDGFVVPFKD